MKTNRKAALLLGAFALGACSESERADTAAPSEEQQADMVEQAVRQNYDQSGADVVEIEMARSADGSRFAGYARVRDRASGDEITVHCSYSQGPGGDPRLACNRVREGEDAAPATPPEG